MISFAKYSGPYGDYIQLADWIATVAATYNISAFVGNPSTNGCPFNFSNFSYELTAEQNACFVVLMNPSVNNMCIVVTMGVNLTASYAKYTGISTGFSAIFSVDESGQLSCIRDTFYLADKAWIFSGKQNVALTFSDGDNYATVLLGESAWAVTNSYSKKLNIVSAGLNTIAIPQSNPADYHTLIVNKPRSEIGVALLAFPKSDPNRSVTRSTVLIQGVTYEIVALGPNNTLLALY